tara:strand:- start:649 stop:1026 length:378 start_codon:yes stop_codon:yes gene_type:complete
MSSALFRRVEQLLLASAGGYPVLFVGALYLTYVVAWGALGHAPILSLDDPKGLGVLVDVPYVLTIVLMMGAPAAMLLGVVVLPIALQRRTKPWRVGYGLILALLWVAAIVFLRWDPWDVGTWFLD